MSFPTSCVLLACASLSLWLSDEGAVGLRRNLWLVALGVALVAAHLAGFVGLAGLACVLVFGGIVAAYFRAPLHGAWRALPAVAVVGGSVALMLHRLPGFHNPRLLDAARFTPDAVPFTLYGNFDKTLVGLFILGWGHSRIARASDWLSLFKRTAPIALVTTGGVLVASLILGYVHFAPKLPSATLIWLPVNLLFVCVAEEGFFRGFVQAELTRLWNDRHWGAPAAIVVGAGLFGLAHLAGGWTYVGLATIAGAGYGCAYWRTGRIEAAILTHFVLNTLHFLAFTYPALAR